MNRRQFLQGAGVGLLGLGGYAGGNRLVDSPERAVSVSGTASGDSLSVGGTADRGFTDDHPAVVEFSLRNTGSDSLGLFFPSGDTDVSAPAVPVSALVAEHDTASTELVGIPEDRSHIQPLVDPVPVTTGLTDCWHVRTTRWGQNDIQRGADLDPGESVDGRYTLLQRPTPVDRARPGSCLDTGRYRIEQPVTVTVDEDDGRRESTTVEFWLELS